MKAVRRAQDGREEGFSWLFECYRTPLHRFIRRYRDLDPDTAHDVLQAVFIRAFRSIGSLRDPACFEAWVLRIARRESLRALERRRGHAPLEAVLEQRCEAEARAVENLERERLIEQLRALTAEVQPDSIRETATRYYLREPPCTTEALAAELGVPPATVRKRLYLFRNKLRERLRQEGVLST